MCTNTHCVWINTRCTKLHNGPFRVQYEKIPLTWIFLHSRRDWRDCQIWGMQVCQSYINGQMEWWFHFLFTVSDGQPGFNWGWVRFSLILFRHDAGTCYLSASATCLPSIELAKLWYLSMYGRTVILLWICLPIFTLCWYILPFWSWKITRPNRKVNPYSQLYRKIYYY